MILTILIFLIILGLLVFVHELGHFIVAKRNGVRVNEFGFGFPPRLIGLERVASPKIEMIEQKEEVNLEAEVGGQAVETVVVTRQQELVRVRQTKKWRLFFGKNKSQNQEGEVYSLNLIPLGGFVKIYGEEGEGEKNPHSFMAKTAWQKTLILFAGVFMNFLLAVFLFALGHFIGLPSAIDESEVAKYPDARLQIVNIIQGSPAASAGLTSGDFVIGLKDFQGRILEGIKRPSQFQDFVDNEKGKEITVIVQRGGSNIDFVLTPRVNPPSGQGPLGVELASVAQIRLPWYQAIWQGFLTTVELLWLFVSALYVIIKNLFITGQAGVDVVGPVGIFNLTGQAATMGFIYLLQLTAMLSINLAVINAFPFPALDGGRVLFILIEKIKGSPIKAKTAGLVNTIGFALLIALMAFVTFRDITKIF